MPGRLVQELNVCTVDIKCVYPCSRVPVNISSIALIPVVLISELII